MVKLRPEDDVAYFRDVNLAEQMSGIVEHRNIRCAAAADGMNEVAHLHIGLYGGIVLVDEVVEVHQREHRTVGVVGNEFSLPCQSDSVYAVLFEDGYREISRDGHNDQRYEQRVASQVSSAMRKMPVSGACITAAITAAMP